MKKENQTAPVGLGKGKLLAIILAIAFTLVFLGACKGPENSQEDPSKTSAEVVTGQKALDFYDSTDESKGYNKNLFYRNELDQDNMADPSAIYITEGKEKGWFYKYATSSDYGNGIVLGWKSKDLANWECVGPAYNPRDFALEDRNNNWAVQNFWAPEVIYYKPSAQDAEKYDAQMEGISAGAYYMFFSSMNQYKRANSTDPNAVGLYHVGLAISKSPAGPFIQWTGKNSDNRDVAISDAWLDASKLSDHSSGANHLKLKDKPIIDASPFVDDDNQIYFYFTRDRQNGNPASTNWGMKLKDMFTPAYGTEVPVTAYRRQTPTAATENFTTETGNSNEGPHMLKHNGKYYMTFSVSFYEDRTYSVAQAVSDSPLGEFKKIPWDKGGMILSAGGTQSGVQYPIQGSDYYDFMAGTGHHSFVTVGNETFIVYHAFTNRVSIHGGRRVAIDRIKFIPHPDGKSKPADEPEELIYANGPTLSMQALPEEVSGYNNIASLATVNANRGENKEALTDGIHKTHNYEFVNEFSANDSVAITLTFPKYYDIGAIMIYEPYRHENSFSKVDSIVLDSDQEISEGKIFRGQAKMQNVKLNRSLAMFENPDVPEDKVMRPGGAVVAEFNEIAANKITIVINKTSWENKAASGSLKIGEIVVLGKESKTPNGTKNKYETEKTGSFDLASYSFTNPDAIDRGAWRKLDNPEKVVLDGVFDDAIWQNVPASNTIENLNIDSGLRSVKMSVVLGEEGFFTKVEVKDPSVFFNRAFADTKFNNSGLVLHFGPQKASANANTIRYDDIQLRTFCNSAVEPWYGRKTLDDNYPMIYTYVETESYVRIIDKQGKELPVPLKYDEINFPISSGVAGYNVEVYTRYSAIGLTSKPTGIIGTYELNYKDSFAAGRKGSSFFSGTNHLSLANYHLFS